MLPPFWRKPRLALLLLCSACWYASVVVAEPAAEGWTLIRQVDDLALYRRPVQDSAQPALLARVRFDAPPGKVHGVISDYDRFAEFIPLVKDSRILERNGRMTWVYQRLDLPLLVADRHYVIRSVDDLQALAAGVINVRWQIDRARSDALPADQAVLPAAMSGYWRLRALPGEQGCDAEYSVHVEPGGDVPGWLFSRVSERYVVQVVDAVRRRVAGQNEVGSR